jgi:hypothetical protein
VKIADGLSTDRLRGRYAEQGRSASAEQESYRENKANDFRTNHRGVCFSLMSIGSNGVTAGGNAPSLWCASVIDADTAASPYSGARSA